MYGRAKFVTRKSCRAQPDVRPPLLTELYGPVHLVKRAVGVQPFIQSSFRSGMCVTKLCAAM